jgi:hypothetical protein
MSDITLSHRAKRRTTIYISQDVLEFLTLRRARGAGSVSQQLEALARHKMPRRYSREELARLEAQHAEGYEKHPVEAGEFDLWENEQDWGGG